MKRLKDFVILNVLFYIELFVMYIVSCVKFYFRKDYYLYIPYKMDNKTGYLVSIRYIPIDLCIADLVPFEYYYAECLYEDEYYKNVEIFVPNKTIMFNLIKDITKFIKMTTDYPKYM